MDPNIVQDLSHNPIVDAKVPTLYPGELEWLIDQAQQNPLLRTGLLQYSAYKKAIKQDQDDILAQNAILAETQDLK